MTTTIGTGWGVGTVRHRPWSTVLVTLHALGLAVAAGGVGLGVVAMVADLVDRTDSWDGFLLFFGGLLAVASAVVGASYGVALALTRRGRRRADEGRTGTLLTAAFVSGAISVFALIGAVGFLYVAFMDGAGYSMFGSFLLLPAALGLLASIRTARVCG